jgi:hypothetical protein
MMLSIIYVNQAMQRYLKRKIEQVYKETFFRTRVLFTVYGKNTIIILVALSFTEDILSVDSHFFNPNLGGHRKKHCLAAEKLV